MYVCLFFFFILVSEFQATHLPWGVPEGGAGREGCILAQKGFVTGYSTSLRLPLWVAYRLDGEVRKTRIIQFDEKVISKHLGTAMKTLAR